MSVLVEHHLKYLEIDGMDETEWITKSQHQKTHANHHIPKNISDKAHHRTRKWLDRTNRTRIDFSTTVGENVRVIERIQIYEQTGTVSVYSRFRPNR